jgi:hypothetical protein
MSASESFLDSLPALIIACRTKGIGTRTWAGHAADPGNVPREKRDSNSSSAAQSLGLERML